MSIFVSLVILFVVVLFLLLAFAISIALASRGLRERETEWPTNWATPTEEVGPQGIVHDEREAEAHRIA